MTMPEGNETLIMTKDNGRTILKESSIFGVSIRGIVALVLATTICFREIGKVVISGWICIKNNDLSMLGSQISIDEPFYSIAVAVMAYYFAKMTMKVDSK